MMMHWRYLFIPLALLSLCLTAGTESRGAIVLSFQPTSQTVQVGQTAQFDIFFTADQNVNVAGYQINVVADAGAFTSGAIDFTIGTGVGQEWDLATTPKEAFTTYDSFTQDPNNPPTAPLTANVATRFGRLSLDTTGLAVGTTYQIRFTDVTVTNVVGGSLGGVNGGAASYTVSAVPEPTSIALVCLAGCAGVFARVRRRS